MTILLLLTCCIAAWHDSIFMSTQTLSFVDLGRTAAQRGCTYRWSAVRLNLSDERQTERTWPSHDTDKTGGSINRVNIALSFSKHKPVIICLQICYNFELSLNLFMILFYTFTITLYRYSKINFISYWK